MSQLASQRNWRLQRTNFAQCDVGISDFASSGNSEWWYHWTLDSPPDPSPSCTSASTGVQPTAFIFRSSNPRQCALFRIGLWWCDEQNMLLGSFVRGCANLAGIMWHFGASVLMASPIKLAQGAVTTVMISLVIGVPLCNCTIFGSGKDQNLVLAEVPTADSNTSWNSRLHNTDRLNCSSTCGCRSAKAVADVIFALDTSRSNLLDKDGRYSQYQIGCPPGPAYIARLKRILRTFLLPLAADDQLGRDGVRIAVVQFDSTGRVLLNLQDTKAGDRAGTSVLAAVDNMDIQLDGSTLFSAGFEVIVRDVLLGSKQRRGWRRFRVPTVIVTLSDGQGALNVDQFRSMLTGHEYNMLSPDIKNLRMAAFDVGLSLESGGSPADTIDAEYVDGQTFGELEAQVLELAGRDYVGSLPCDADQQELADLLEPINKFIPILAGSCSDPLSISPSQTPTTATSAGPTGSPTFAPSIVYTSSPSLRATSTPSDSPSEVPSLPAEICPDGAIFHFDRPVVAVKAAPRDVLEAFAMFPNGAGPDACALLCLKNSQCGAFDFDIRNSRCRLSSFPTLPPRRVAERYSFFIRREPGDCRGQHNSSKPTNQPTPVLSPSPSQHTNAPMQTPTVTPSSMISPVTGPTSALFPSDSPTGKPTGEPTETSNACSENTPVCIMLQFAGFTCANLQFSLSCPVRCGTCEQFHPTTKPTSLNLEALPSVLPTGQPTTTSNPPTPSPTSSSTSSPIIGPSLPPTQSLSISPTSSPSIDLSFPPTQSPSIEPTEPPTWGPSRIPTRVPTTGSPTEEPTVLLSSVPSDMRTSTPSSSPTATPSCTDVDSVLCTGLKQFCNTTAGFVDLCPVLCRISPCIDKFTTTKTSETPATLTTVCPNQLSCGSVNPKTLVSYCGTELPLPVCNSPDVCYCDSLCPIPGFGPCCTSYVDECTV